MSSVSGPGSVTPNANVTGTTATTATTGTQGTGDAENQTPEIVGDPNATGAAQVLDRKVAGLPDDFDVKNLITSTWLDVGMVAQGMTGDAIQRPSQGGSFIGYGDITRVDPTTNGFEIDVQVYSQKAEDEVALFMQLPLIDKKSGKLTYLNLDMLTASGKDDLTDKISTQKTKDPISGRDCFTGRRTYRFSLDQINKFLKKQGLGVRVSPGDRITVSGVVKGDGHRVMNATSNGFNIPKPLGGSTSSSDVVGLSRLGQEPLLRGEDIPLDIGVKLAQKVLDQRIYPSGGGSFKVGDIIEGDITTRLESEYKGSVSEQHMESMIDNAYELAELSTQALGGDAKARKELDKRLGKNLVLEPVMRHYMCDDGKPLGTEQSRLDDLNSGKLQIARDDKGRPKLDPMEDNYSDDKDLTFSKKSGAARVRGNAQRRGHAEFKLTGGVLDPKTGIRQRIETGLGLKAGASEDKLQQLFKYIMDNPSSAVAQSPLGHVVREALKAEVGEALTQNRTPWADVTQVRHKFELKNTKTGTKAELSLDAVEAVTVRPEHEVDGKPQTASYFVIETELDHVQIASDNMVEQTEAKDKAALTTKAAQTDFLTDAKDKVKSGDMEFEIQRDVELHGLAHLEDDSFRSTPSYKDFEGMNDALLAAVCGNQLPGDARQKSAHFAELLGLVPPEQTVTV